MFLGLLERLLIMLPAKFLSFRLVRFFPFYCVFLQPYFIWPISHFRRIPISNWKLLMSVVKFIPRQHYNIDSIFSFNQFRLKCWPFCQKADRMREGFPRGPNILRYFSKRLSNNRKKTWPLDLLLLLDWSPKVRPCMSAQFISTILFQEGLKAPPPWKNEDMWILQTHNHRLR